MLTQLKRDQGFAQAVRLQLATGTRDFDAQTVTHLLAIVDREWARFEQLAINLISQPDFIADMVEGIRQRSASGELRTDDIREEIDRQLDERD